MIKGFVIAVLFALSSHNLFGQHIEPIKAAELVSLYNSRQEVLVINFWSTWCKPCVEEIPHFIKAIDSLKGPGAQLWLVSQDTKDLYNSGKLKNYVSKNKGWDKAKLFWLSETNADYYCPLIDSGWSGVIPATLILNRATGYRRFFEESLSESKLKEEVEKAF
jgi:thiol-disulfide isomerase/thioredoxin